MNELPTVNHQEPAEKKGDAISASPKMRSARTDPQAGGEPCRPTAIPPLTEFNYQRGGEPQKPVGGDAGSKRPGLLSQILLAIYVPTFDDDPLGVKGHDSGRLLASSIRFFLHLEYESWYLYPAILGTGVKHLCFQALRVGYTHPGVSHESPGCR